MNNGKAIYASLLAVQRDLKCNKNQFNSFGKYKYRSCEDIVEAVKPLLNENGLILIMSDNIAEIGGRIYIQATATVMDIINGDKINVTAMAREPEEKKGMDSSQITGTASSYARKYALNGLFAIDDTKDADTDAYHNQTAQNAPQATEKPSKGKPMGATTKNAPAKADEVRRACLAKLNAEIKRLGYSKDDLATIATHVVGKNTAKDMTDDEILKLAEYLQGEKVK